ncbi:MAG: hypothetical protein JXA77_06095 [Bacteroidales bacterium]|nr:hypothetical protein [Bacteroidales bacterium]MBN2820610.1 hypothetical protein [Bacteroidales bacterium]
MKKFISLLLLFSITLVIFNGCETTTNNTPPELPPYESMVIDFSKFNSGDKSTDDVQDSTMLNYAAAGLTVFFWNAALTVTLVVPVAAFAQSFNHQAEFLGDKTWQWTYDCNGLANTYTARLVGVLRSDDIKWEMYLSKAGVAAHEEFLWFEGTSDLDGNGGQWILYHSFALQEQVLQIDWEKTNDAVGLVKYTYVRESDNGDPNQLTAGSNLTYGLTDSVLDAFYSIDFNKRNRNADENQSVEIEWSTTEYFGHIKALHYFQDENWHCWDSNGYDTDCE